MLLSFTCFKPSWQFILILGTTTENDQTVCNIVICLWTYKVAAFTADACSEYL